MPDGVRGYKSCVVIAIISPSETSGRKEHQMKQPTFRFVKEYANYKIRMNQDLAKNFPDMADALNGSTVYIRSIYSKWDSGLIRTDEAMALIAKA